MSSIDKEAGKLEMLYGALAEIVLELVSSDGETVDDNLASILMFTGNRPVGARPWEDVENENIEACWSEEEITYFMEPSVYESYLHEKIEQWNAMTVDAQVWDI
jgi:hypothetical protein